MRIDELYPRVTEAIELAERLEDANDIVAARQAYLDVSMIEEEIAEELSASASQGAIARCGAVSAAMSADQFIRAVELATRYLPEPGLGPDDVAELQDMKDQADAALKLEQLLKQPVIAEARFEIRAV